MFHRMFRRVLAAVSTVPGTRGILQPANRTVETAMTDWNSDLARETLEKILASEAMEKSETSQRLLRYLADRALRGETPKEVEIAIDVFGRDATFNSGEESLVQGGCARAASPPARLLRRQRAGRRMEIRRPQGRVPARVGDARSRRAGGRARTPGCRTGKAASRYVARPRTPQILAAARLGHRGHVAAGAVTVLQCLPGTGRRPALPSIRRLLRSRAPRSGPASSTRIGPSCWWWATASCTRTSIR